MNIEQVISKERILLKDSVKDKADAIQLLARCLKDDGKIDNLNTFLKDIYKREEEYCTYIGHVTAIPHAISESVKEASIAFLRVREGFVYGNEEERVQLLFMLAIPCDSNEEHLRMLSMLAKNLMHKEFRNALMQANDIDELYQIFMEIH